MLLCCSCQRQQFWKKKVSYLKNYVTWQILNRGLIHNGYAKKRFVTKRFLTRNFRGTLRATCSKSGQPQPSTGNGERFKISKNVSCEAKVTTKPINAKLEEDLKLLIDGHKARYNFDDEKMKHICQISNIVLAHTNHSTINCQHFAKTINTSSDLLSNKT